MKLIGMITHKGMVFDVRKDNKGLVHFYYLTNPVSNSLPNLIEALAIQWALKGDNVYTDVL